ncbi:MAG: TetR/AcrR family transcriptional regulator [Opitutaceae bacterium]
MSQKMNPSISDKTRQKIIRTTEKLFAEKGFRAMTLRDVTREAKVNLAAVNYHFGSKSKLILEVIRDRIEPINEERLKRLDQLIEQYAPQPVPVNSIFDSLFRPLFESDGAGSGPNPALIQMIGRAFTEPADFMRGMHRDLFRDLTQRYLAELHRSCPDMTIETLQYRFFLSISTMLGATIDQVILENLSESKLGPRNYDRVVTELINYASAGFEQSAK